jgi:hypothetical protein
MSSVTMNLDLEQIKIIKDIVYKAKYEDNGKKVLFLQSFLDVSKLDSLNMIIISINGEWLGLTLKPLLLYEYFK